jgi:hypothetical protein
MFFTQKKKEKKKKERSTISIVGLSGDECERQRRAANIIVSISSFL